MNIVDVKNVTKRFNDKLVLDNISFQIKEGEIFGLIGPNGAGKSTLINIITTLLASNSGEISICGYDIKKDPLKAKANIGLVPQELAIIEEMSAYDNLEFFGSFYKLHGKVLKERIKEVLDITGLYDRRKEKVKTFSGGMKRRLNIAAAIMHHPKVLIMDEPTVGVDPQSRNLIFEFTKRVCKEEGMTVIYTSHYMEEIEELCSRIFIIDLGEEVSYGTKDEILETININTKVKIEATGVNAEALYKISKLPSVVDVTEDDDKSLLIEITNNFKISEVISLLEESNAVLNKISYVEVKLEDAFLLLTGKSLRD